MEKRIFLTPSRTRGNKSTVKSTLANKCAFEHSIYVCVYIYVYMCVCVCMYVRVFILTSSLVGRTETNFQFARFELPLAGMLIRLLFHFFLFFVLFYFVTIAFCHSSTYKHARTRAQQTHRHAYIRSSRFAPYLLVFRYLRSYLFLVRFTRALVIVSRTHTTRKDQQSTLFFFFLPRPVDQSSVIEITDRRTSDKWSEHDSKA